MERVGDFVVLRSGGPIWQIGAAGERWLALYYNDRGVPVSAAADRAEVLPVDFDLGREAHRSYRAVGRGR